MQYKRAWQVKLNSSTTAKYIQLATPYHIPSIVSGSSCKAIASLQFKVSDFELNMFSQDAVLKINNRFSLSNYFPVLRGITHHSSRIGLVVKAPSRQIRPKTSAIRIPFRMNTLRCGAKKFVTHQIVYSWNKQSPLPGTACRYFINLNKLMYSLWQITGAG